MTMIFKLITAAQRTWRKLKGSSRVPKVIKGVKFTDGIELTETNQHAAA